MEISIHINGPGGTLAAPILALRETLEKLGAVVTVHDAHPVPDDLARKVLAKGPIFTDTVATIVARHYPWGG